MSTVIDLKNATIKLKDGGANSLTIKLGAGNCTIGAHHAREYFKDRGKLDSVRDADQAPVDVKIDGTWEFLRAVAGAGVPTPMEVFRKIGEAAAWVTAGADACEPFALIVEITNDPLGSTVKTEVITLDEFRPDTIDGDPKAATFSVAGRCKILRPAAARS